MNRTQIKLKGSLITLLFGTWVMGQLIKSGHSLDKLQEDMRTNPFEFFPLLVYLGAVNATENKELSSFNKNDFYDWIDEVGGLSSEEVVKVINCFTNSLGADVGESKKKAAKPTAKSR